MPIIIILMLTTTAGVVMSLINKPMAIGLGVGIALGVSLLLSVVRRLGRKSQKSLLANEVFYTITKYKARVFNIPMPQQEKTTKQATIYGKGHDYADLMDILKKQLNFPAETAKQAAKYAMDNAGDNPMEEKIRVALQYIGSDNKNVSTKD